MRSCDYAYINLLNGTQNVKISFVRAFLWIASQDVILKVYFSILTYFVALLFLWHFAWWGGKSTEPGDVQLSGNELHLRLGLKGWFLPTSLLVKKEGASSVLPKGYVYHGSQGLFLSCYLFIDCFPPCGDPKQLITSFSPPPPNPHNSYLVARWETVMHLQSPAEAPWTK